MEKGGLTGPASSRSPWSWWTSQGLPPAGHPGVGGPHRACLQQVTLELVDLTGPASSRSPWSWWTSQGLPPAGHPGVGGPHRACLQHVMDLTGPASRTSQGCLRSTMDQINVIQTDAGSSQYESSQGLGSPWSWWTWMYKTGQQYIGVQQYIRK